MARDSTRPALTPIASHGRLRRSSRMLGLLQLVGAALAVVLVSGLVVAGVTVQQLEANIDTVSLGGEDGGAPPTIGDYEGGFNLLIVGIDEGYGRDATLNDVNILVHVSADHSNATAVSFPRDLIVPIPSCERQDGEGSNAAMSARPLNEAWYYGGLPCVVRTIEKITDLEIPFAAKTTFAGVVDMSTAVGGVTVCTTGPIYDRNAHGLAIPSAGEHTLEGVQALGFLQTRYGVGNGSDLGRISNQQVFLSALVRKVTSEGTLDDPATLYRLATAVTRSMTLSTSMSNVPTLVSMASVFKNMSLDRITFVQYPAVPGSGAYANKVLPVTRVADELMERLRADLPVVAEETGIGSVANPDVPTGETPATPEPSTEATTDPAPSAPETETEPEAIEGLLGQSAAQSTCAKANN